MSCLGREELFAYVQHLLEPREEKRVRSHVDQCPACRETVGDYQRLGAVLDEWKPTEPSPRFDARVRAAVAAGHRRRERPRVFLGWQWGRWLAPAFVVLLVVAASLLVVRTRRSQDVPTPTARQELPKPIVSAPSTDQTTTVTQGDTDELSLYQNLPVLEELDILTNFDVLSELARRNKKVVN